jgi:hypothetical protein
MDLKVEEEGGRSKIQGNGKKKKRKEDRKRLRESKNISFITHSILFFFYIPLFLTLNSFVFFLLFLFFFLFFCCYCDIRRMDGRQTAVPKGLRPTEVSCWGGDKEEGVGYMVYKYAYGVITNNNKGFGVGKEVDYLFDTNTRVNRNPKTV